jgi:ectoine hydroxylase
MTSRNDIYPSRKGGDARMLERVDPIVYTDGKSGAPLSEAQTESYRRNGYLVKRELFDASEIRVLSAELERLQAAYQHSDESSVIREPQSDELRSIFEVHKKSPVLARLACDSRLVDIASYLLGSDVYIHQSRLNNKPGFRGREFYWHSDFETWHVEDGVPNMRAMSVSISLSKNVAANGPLMLVPGSHKKYVSCPGKTPDDHYKESLREQRFGVPPDHLLAELIDAGGIDAVTGPAGSVTFFDCNTLHGSNSNISPYPRANVFLVYNSVNNQPVAPFGSRTPRPDFLAERANFTAVERAVGTIS